MDDLAKEQLDELISLVGGIAISFAYLEAALDLCIDSLFHEWEGKQSAPEIPRTAMSKKVEFLRAVSAPGTLIHVLFLNLDEIANRIETLAEARHQVIHGVMSVAIDPAGNTEFTRIVRKKAASHHVVAKIGPNELTALRNDIHLLATFLTAFADNLFEHGSPDKRDQARSE